MQRDRCWPELGPDSLAATAVPSGANARQWVFFRSATRRTRPPPTGPRRFRGADGLAANPQRSSSSRRCRALDRSGDPTMSRNRSRVGPAIRAAREAADAHCRSCLASPRSRGSVLSRLKRPASQLKARPTRSASMRGRQLLGFHAASHKAVPRRLGIRIPSAHRIDAGTPVAGSSRARIAPSKCFAARISAMWRWRGCCPSAASPHQSSADLVSRSISTVLLPEANPAKDPMSKRT